MRLAFFVTILMVINIRDFEFDENVDNGISQIFEMYRKEGLDEDWMSATPFN